MKICVAGWHFWPELYGQLEKINRKYPVFIVANRRNALLSKFDHKVRQNTGLDWGAYNYYLMKIWDGKSPVLFQHDDIKVDDIAVYDTIARIEWDQSYIFGNEEEQELNRGVHGRAMICSGKLLAILKAEGGIWYDRDNWGNTTEPFPIKGLHYNEAVCRFRDRMRGMRKVVCDKETLVPGFQPARRGKL